MPSQRISFLEQIFNVMDQVMLPQESEDDQQGAWMITSCQMKTIDLVQCLILFNIIILIIPKFDTGLSLQKIPDAIYFEIVHLVQNELN